MLRRRTAVPALRVQLTRITDDLDSWPIATVEHAPEGIDANTNVTLHRLAVIGAMRALHAKPAYASPFAQLTETIWERVLTDGPEQAESFRVRDVIELDRDGFRTDTPEARAALVLLRGLPELGPRTDTGGSARLTVLLRHPTRATAPHPTIKSKSPEICLLGLVAAYEHLVRHSPWETVVRPAGQGIRRALHSLEEQPGTYRVPSFDETSALYLSASYV